MMTEYAEAVRFRDGFQWPEDVAAARAAEGRRCLMVNFIPAIVSRVIASSGSSADEEAITLDVVRKCRDSQRTYNLLHSNYIEYVHTIGHNHELTDEFIKGIEQARSDMWAAVGLSPPVRPSLQREGINRNGNNSEDGIINREYLLAAAREIPTHSHLLTDEWNPLVDFNHMLHLVSEMHNRGWLISYEEIVPNGASKAEFTPFESACVHPETAVQREGETLLIAVVKAAVAAVSAEPKHRRIVDRFEANPGKVVA